MLDKLRIQVMGAMGAKHSYFGIGWSPDSEFQALSPISASVACFKRLSSLTPRSERQRRDRVRPSQNFGARRLKIADVLRNFSSMSLPMNFDSLSPQS